MSEDVDGKKELQENGTFELHYAPSDKRNKSFTIPISAPHNYQLDKPVEGNEQQNSSETKDDPNQLDVKVIDMINSRL